MTIDWFDLHNINVEPLTSRQKQILNAVIIGYIKNAEPISSSKIVHNYDLSISSATVRNDLSFLEKCGYLSHPHTSAGRVPTDKGYRYYVDCLVSDDHLSISRLNTVNDFYSVIGRELEDLLEETSVMLSKITRCAAVLMSPPHNDSTVKRIELIKLSNLQTMILVIMSEGTIWKQNIKTAKAVKQTDLRKIENVVNQYCAGARGDQLRERAHQCYQAIKSLYKQDLLLKIVSALSGLKKEEKIIVEGASNLLKEPEFGMVTKVRELFSFLDEHAYLANLLSEVAKSEGVVIKIGSEFSNVYEELSFIGKTFTVNGAIGTLGVFGPRRMNYPRAISTVDRIADALTFALAEV